MKTLGGLLDELREQRFDNFDHWVREAQQRLAYSSEEARALCFDAKGRRCWIGKDFMRARDEHAFPVRYIWPEQVGKLLDSAFNPGHIRPTSKLGPAFYQD